MVTDMELTDELIAAMAKADARVGVGSDRCFALPHRLEDAPELHPEGPLQGGLDHEPGRSGKLRRLARGEYGTGQAPPSGRRLNEWPLWLFHVTQRCGTVVQYSYFMLHNDVAQYSKSSYPCEQLRGECIGNKLSLSSKH